MILILHYYFYVYYYLLLKLKSVLLFLGIVPDAIQTECSKCSERQKVQAGKVLAHLLQHKPEYWKLLLQRFDPNNVYLRRFMSDDDDEKLSLQKISNDTNTSIMTN